MNYHYRLWKYKQASSLIPLAAFLLALALSPGCSSSDDNSSPGNGNTTVGNPNENPVPPSPSPTPTQKPSPSPSPSPTAPPSPSPSPSPSASATPSPTASPSPSPSPSPAGITRTLELKPYRETCRAAGPRLCLIASIDGGEPQLLYSEIQGFDWKWGHSYTVEVTEPTLQNPPPDSPSMKYTLKQILKETRSPEGATFDTDLTQEFVDASPSCLFSLGGTVEFTTETPGVCASLNEALNSNSHVLATLRYTNVTARPILLTSLRTDNGTNQITWTRLFFRQDHTLDESCGKPTLFTAFSSGRFEKSGCSGVISGTLNELELQNLNSFAKTVADSDLNTPLNCDNHPTDEVRTVDLALSSSEIYRVYLSGANRGTCTRGPQPAVGNLEKTAAELAGHYPIEPLPDHSESPPGHE